MAELTQPGAELLLPRLQPLVTLLALELLPRAALLPLPVRLCGQRLERSAHPAALQPATGEGLEVCWAMEARSVAEEGSTHLVRRRQGVRYGARGAAWGSAAPS